MKLSQLRLSGAGALAVPGVAFLAAFFIVPVGLMISESFSGDEGALATYREVLVSDTNRAVLVNSLTLCLQVTAVTAVVGMALLMALDRWGKVGKAIILLALLFPFVTGGELVRILAWQIILSPDSYVTSALQWLHLTAEGQALVPGRPAIVIGLVHVVLPYFVFTAFAGTRSINKRLMAASASMGATPTQTYLSVWLPLAAPALFASTLLVFVITLGYYATPAALGGAGDLVASVAITDSVQKLGDWSTAAAMGTVLLLLTVVILAVVFKFGGMKVLYGSLGMGSSSASSGSVGGAWNGAVTSHAFAKVAGVLESIPGIGLASRAVHVLTVAGAVVFLAAPLIVAIPASFTDSQLLTFPPKGFSVQWYDVFLSDESWTSGTRTSLFVGVISAVVAVILGLMISLALARGRFRGKSLVLVLALAPLIMPWIVTALGLYFEANRLGIAYSDLGLIVGHIVAALPYPVLVLVSAMTGFDWATDRAAQSCGANVLQRGRDVLLPYLKPALISALLFAFMVSFTEIAYALLMSSPVSSTLPVVMFQGLTLNITPAVAAACGVISGVLIVLLVVVEISSRVAKRSPSS